MRVKEHKLLIRHKEKKGELSNTGMGPREVVKSSSLDVFNTLLDNVLNILM